jgi:hypothetical protein
MYHKDDMSVSHAICIPSMHRLYGPDIFATARQCTWKDNNVTSIRYKVAGPVTRCVRESDHRGMC